MGRFMKKYIIFGMILLMLSVPVVLAGTGGLRISPTWPVMVSSPSDFTVWAQSADAYDVHVLLVTTEECYTEFADAPIVVASVSYPAGGCSIGFTKNAFNSATVNSEKVPGDATEGAAYTVASLKDHLDEGLSTPLGSGDTIYWAYASLGDLCSDFDPLTTTPVTITVSEEGCSSPRMLIYMLGRSEEGAELLDMNVPPTQPGFMVPEIAVGSVMAIASMFAALGLYAHKKKQKPTR
jgi:hypothetical protein